MKYLTPPFLYNALCCLEVKNFSSLMYFQLVGNFSASGRTARRRGRFGWCLYCQAAMQLCQAFCVSQNKCSLRSDSCWRVQVCLLYQLFSDWQNWMVCSIALFFTEWFGLEEAILFKQCYSGLCCLGFYYLQGQGLRNCLWAACSSIQLALQ